MLELFLNTGQRLRVIQTLQWRDIDLDNGIFYIPEVDGTKGAEKVGNKRPLMGAREYVRQWKEYHPNPEPNAYVITHRRNPGTAWETRGNAHEHLKESTIRRVCKKWVREAGINKPGNPHNIRHSFTTIAKKDYNMDNDTIRWLLGHDEGSRVMETTYKHLSADDYIKKAEESAGLRQPETESPFTPAACHVCDHPLDSKDRVCPRCGEEYGFDAKSVKDDIEKSKDQDPSDSEARAIDKLTETLENDPEAATAIMQMAQQFADKD